MSKLANRPDWADDEDFDDPNTLPAPQITVNKDGTKTIISYRFSDTGKKVKSTRRIRTTTVRETVNPRVASRRAWPKFGLEKGHAAGPSFDTTSVGENISFQPRGDWKSSAKEAEKADGGKGDLKAQLRDKKVKCRICDGEHFTARCPFKDTMAPVSEFAEEADLREIFERFGRVTRVFLAKDRETGRAKGFAFISYQERSDAAKACEKIDGYGYGHLILRVEFAKRAT
ncbi:MAG: eukaryotic translation initiation factor 3 subunit G [Lasallia pustulata]|uniref:Eukaryotic translation initiation factor 3 subunit G n=1 Tax=Lasallia pustulata TaxID=136370 RepID=A0A5M8PYV7_9LECA|nr:MAG: eukaryotic translation initiation factor 3 subunit G [Lasallia pustulata]